MLHCQRLIAAATLSLAIVAPIDLTRAADLPSKHTKAVSFLDTPFFSLIDNRLTYAYEFSSISPGNVATGGKQILAFTHFDAWAYGTNVVNILMGKASANDPAAPCKLPGQGCGGSMEFGATIKSTLGFNQIFNTSAFSIGPMRNVSLAVGAGEGIKNTTSGIDRKYLTAGLQFAFDLPYKGYFNVTPQFYKGWQYTGSYTSAVLGPAYPGAPNGWLDYNGTWSIDMNYYMDLGFLPETIPLAVSGRFTWIGPLATGLSPGVLPASILAPTKIELVSEPIRLTLDASKVLWGPKYSHFADIWVAYKYRLNTLGLDNENSPACARNSCRISSLYSGISIKF
ncbi:hypothetical protein UP10_36730 [Bradyrhizobium sp. LTSPM299]|jgi:hypothetical protein|uniref:hypothetical protein n=1 Tax=Bradyrhizobium sp. LTSPM299 TaxID=1619233 RepID=UPI0005C958FD|nr:hypothetical protein [Bradyrhizobium sp. LTSPM299]KJC55932.1 hypothetical protein UP10_36730 [Bradyrhizobium sp. LTSPM299]